MISIAAPVSEPSCSSRDDVGTTCGLGEYCFQEEEEKQCRFHIRGRRILSEKLTCLAEFLPADCVRRHCKLGGGSASIPGTSVYRGSKCGCFLTQLSGSLRCLPRTNDHINMLQLCSLIPQKPSKIYSQQNQLTRWTLSATAHRRKGRRNIL